MITMALGPQKHRNIRKSIQRKDKNKAIPRPTLSEDPSILSQNPTQLRTTMGLQWYKVYKPVLKVCDIVFKKNTKCQLNKKCAIEEQRQL